MRRVKINTTSNSYRSLSAFPEPVQPKNLSFPETNGRKFRSEWYSEHPYLSYSVADDSVTCHTCRRALSLKFMRRSDFKETAFLDGFSNWKKATTKFKDHSKSAQHLLAREKLTLSARLPVEKCVARATEMEHKRNREVFMEIICTIRGLARSGSALRGHGDEHVSGRLMTLLDERSATSPEINAWINKRNNFLSHDCQDEIIQIMASMVLREVLEEARRSLFYGVIADGTTDLSTKEQFSICVRYATQELVVKEAFLGLYEVPGSTAAQLYEALKDALVRTMYGTEKLRGHCFDGASNMSGRVSGVQKRIVEDQPRSVFVHCVNHSLDLALVEEAKKKNPQIADALNTVRDVVGILKTTKRKHLFEEHFRELNLHDIEDADCRQRATPHKLLALCPTRWTVRCQAVARFLEEYDAVILALEDVDADVSASPDVRHKVRGYLRHLHQFETVFALMMCERMFRPCELFAKALQRPGINSGDVRRGADMLLDTLRTLREDGFGDLWTDCRSKIQKLTTCIDPPREPRRSRPPKRLEHCDNAAPPAVLTAEDSLRRGFFEAMDLVSSEVRRRFKQPGLERLEKLENLLLGNQKDVSCAEVAEILKAAGDCGEDGSAGDFVPDVLASQLNMLRQCRSIPQPARSINDLVGVIMEQGALCREMMSEVLRLAARIMVVPMSGASSERSFSALCRIKTPSRTTMTQARLSNLVLLDIHSDVARSLKPQAILRQFVNNHPMKRVTVFGRL